MRLADFAHSIDIGQNLLEATKGYVRIPKWTLAANGAGDLDLGNLRHIIKKTTQLLVETRDMCLALACAAKPFRTAHKNNQLKDRITPQVNFIQWLKRHGERRKDKGDGGGSIILRVVCEKLCVTKLCVKELCVKDCQ